MHLKELLFLIIAGVFMVVQFLVWRTLLPDIASGNNPFYGNFVIPLVLLLFAGIFFAFSAVFVRSTSAVFVSLGVFASVPLFFREADMVGVALFLINILVVCFAVYRMRKEHELAVSFSITALFKEGVPLYFTTVALVISVFYVAYVDEEKAFAALLPKSVFDIALRSSTGPLESLLGISSIDPNATMDEILGIIAEKELSSRGLPASQISKKELSDFVASQREQFAEQFGVRFKGDERIKDVFYQTVLDRIELLLGPYKVYLPALSGIAFFLAFKAITYPLYYVSMAVGFFLIKVMIAVKIIKKEIVRIEVERLVL